MSDIRSRIQGMYPDTETRSIKDIANKTGNLYESLVVVSKRARQLSSDIKEELHQKLEEFSVSTDLIKEVNENSEQIEISKFYERLPNSVVISLNEFMNDELIFKNKNSVKEETE